jgi:hypothetical protein
MLKMVRNVQISRHLELMTVAVIGLLIDNNINFDSNWFRECSFSVSRQ